MLTFIRSLRITFLRLYFTIYTLLCHLCILFLLQKGYVSQKSFQKNPGNLEIFCGTSWGFWREPPVKFIFTAVCLCLYSFCNKFFWEISPKFWEDNTFCQKISKFWKILENFGNFWKFLENFWKNILAEKNFGNFWKFLQKFSKNVKSWKFRGL